MEKYIEIKERFEAHQDPENAVKMAKYMNSEYILIKKWSR